MPHLTQISAELRKRFEQNDEPAIAEYVAQLGTYFAKAAAEISDPTVKARTYRQAAIAFNNALIRYQKLEQKEAIERIFQQINLIKINILSAEKIYCTMEKLQGLNEVLLQLQTNRKTLEESADIALSEIETTLAKTNPKDLDVFNEVQKINAIFVKNLALYQQFIEHLTTEIFKIIGHPPCAYAVVAMGSLAKLMPTTRSDLDLMLLIESDSKKEFFKCYTTLLSLCIIDLGETPLIHIRVPELNTYDLYEKDIRGGCSVDVGGAPVEYGPYPLSGSPRIIFSSLDAIKTEFFAPIDASLYCPRLLIGEQSLLAEFQMLNQSRIAKDRDVCDFKELSFSLEQFHSVLDEEMYIKHEWLRQFVEGLVRLARIFKISSVNPCEIIAGLHTQKIINTELVTSLNQLYFLISFFMLKNYQVHHAQVQQLLLHSQILPNHEITKISSGHTVRTAKGFFQHAVLVRKMPAPSERYHLIRNTKVISQSMPWVHQTLYLLTGFRRFLLYFLTRNFKQIQRLPSLEINPKLLFEFSLRHQHLSKNSVNKPKNNTNYLYLHLVEYFQKLQEPRSILKKEGESLCLFLSAGIALISTSLKFARLEAAHFIAKHMVDVLQVFQSLAQLQSLDKRLPTLYAQFLFFKARVILFSTTPNQTFTPAQLQEASICISAAQTCRKCIEEGLTQGLFDDTDNDGSDNLLITLHGPNLVKIASGKTEDLEQALEAYQKALGQNSLTDVACYSKIITINLKLYPFAAAKEKASLLDTIEKECNLALKIALPLKSSLTAVFYNGLGQVFLLRNQLDEAKVQFSNSRRFEESLMRSKGTLLHEANDNLTRLEDKPLSLSL